MKGENAAGIIAYSKIAQFEITVRPEQNTLRFAVRYFALRQCWQKPYNAVMSHTSDVSKHTHTRLTALCPGLPG